MLKILSWNIQAGGGSRIRSIVKAIAKEKPSIVILSEYRNNDSGISLRHALLKAGYRYQAVTASPKNDNSVLLIANIPFDTQLHPTSDELYGHNIVSAHFDAFSVMGVYLPHKKKHTLFSFIADLVQDTPRPYIIAGDFNTGKNYIDQAGNSFWYTDELTKLELLDYLDAYRLVYPDAKEYSWYSHQVNGFRYDHTYIHNSIKPVVSNCYYLHAYREEKVSDHSPMVLELG